MPDLEFRIAGADVLPFAAVPTLRFTLEVEERTGEPIRSLQLSVQVRIAASQRHYTDGERARLKEVFGPASRWTDSVRSLLWTHATVVVPPFTGSTSVDLLISCTYDFEVVSAKYFAALDAGGIPLEFLFSGTVFYEADHGLQAARLSWEKEARFQMPVSLWKQTMEHYFPGSAWLRLRRDVFDRLYRCRSRNALPTWEATIEWLLLQAGGADATEEGR